MTFTYIRLLNDVAILDKIKNISSNPIARSSGIVLFFKIGTVAFNYTFFLILSNLYGAAEVGYFALSITLIQILSIIARSGLEIGMFKEIGFSKNTIRGLRVLQTKSILFISSFSLVILSLIYLFKSTLFNYVFASEALGKYVLIFVLSLPFYTIMFFNGEIHRAKKRYVHFAIFQNFGMYFFLCSFLAAQWIFDFAGFDELVSFFIISLIFLSVLSFIGTFSHSENVGNQEKFSFRSLIKNSIPIGVAGICFFLMRWLDGVVLAQYYSEEMVGTYAIAFRISLLGSFILLSINSALGPRISELSSKQKEDRMFQELKKTTKMGFWLTFPIILFTLIFPEFVLGVFGDEFKSATLPLLVLLIGQMINTIVGPTVIMLQLTGHQKVIKNIILISTLINIILNYLLIPKHGLIGAALVNAFSVILWNVWSTIIVKRTFGRTFFYLPFFSR